MRKLFKRLGFKTEESLTIPFYVIAAIEIPAFWAMVYFPSFWGVLGLYGLQAMVGGYAGLIVSGIYQKQLGGYSSKQLTQVLAANSFISILAAIAATYLYGFLLPGISIQTSLLIAAVATTILGALRLAAPWLSSPRSSARARRRSPSRRRSSTRSWTSTATARTAPTTCPASRARSASALGNTPAPPRGAN
jgi:hypothetical protein